MDQVLAIHSRIYDQFHNSTAGPAFFFKEEHKEAYAAYYTAMYLIQDTGESVWAHTKRGFSPDPHMAYIEFWGVMQAIFIQQDAIKELYKAVIGSEPEISEDSAWLKIREVRNLCAGHPANKGGTRRTFMGRSFGNYSRIQYELWDAHADRQLSHPTLDLCAIIRSYDGEAALTLMEVLAAMAAKWPRADTPKEGT